MVQPDQNPTTPPLKRHPALQPLSREHMSGLIQARALRRAAEAHPDNRPATIAAFVQTWLVEIRDHFDDEERLLLPLTEDPALAERLVAEHRELRALAVRCASDPVAVASEPATLRRLGNLLHDHIRWEERVYFAAIQRNHPDALESMHRQAQEIERQRPGSRARVPDARRATTEQSDA